MIDRIVFLASAFNRKAQVLMPGESTLSIAEIQTKAVEWKDYIETMKDSVPKRPGWGGKEGQLALAALDKVIHAEELTRDDIAGAYMDVYTNFRNMDQYEFKRYLEAYLALG